MKLYIANCTHQRQEVNYRLDFVEPGTGHLIIGIKKPFNKIIIESGRQVAIDLKHTSQADAIMQQLGRVGGRTVGEKNRLPRAVVPYLMQVEKMVPAQLIEEVFNHNRGILAIDGDLRRQQAAVAAGNATVQRALEGNTIKAVKGFEVEYESADEGEGQERLEQGVRLDLNSPAPNNRSSRGRGRRGGSAQA